MIDLLAAAIIAMRSPQLAPIDTTTVIEEDSVGSDGKSLWDCRTMGDLRCGPGATLPDGSLAVPGDYSDPNCWPGAVYCPPAGTPIDSTVIVEPVITQLNPRNLGPTVRAANEKLMVAFINADPPNRVGLDARKSIVLYDRNYLFNYALDRLPSERMLRKLYHQTPVRYWSKGV